MSRFIRKYELLIGDPYTITKEEVLQGPKVPYRSKLKSLEDGVQKADQEKSGYKISDHHIEFKVGKTKNGSSSNTSSIRIANLSDEVVSYLENRSGKKTVILLRAGYEGEDLQTIVLANLEKYRDRFEAETRWTEILLSEGGANLQEATTARYYPKGTSVDTIVNDLISDTFLPRAGANVYPTGEAIAKPWYFNGSVISELIKLGEYYSYNFSIQNGACFWTPAGKANKKLITKVSPETGLIGDVSPIDESQGTSQNSSSTTPGIKFTTLLNGALLPETPIYVESRFKTGAFKVTKVSHRGSYEGEAWFSEVEAEEVVLLD